MPPSRTTMETIIKAIQTTPLPTILISAGVFIIILAFVTKIGGVIEVSQEGKRWAIPVGLFLLFIGLALNFSPSPKSSAAPKSSAVPTSSLSTSSISPPSYPSSESSRSPAPSAPPAFSPPSAFYPSSESSRSPAPSAPPDFSPPSSSFLPPKSSPSTVSSAPPASSPSSTSSPSPKSAQSSSSSVGADRNIANQLLMGEILGIYENREYVGTGNKTAWRHVTISKINDTTLQWKNKAGVSWQLAMTPDKTTLKLGEDCPHYATVKQLRVIWKDGRVAALRFRGRLFEKSS